MKLSRLSTLLAAGTIAGGAVLAGLRPARNLPSCRSPNWVPDVGGERGHPGVLGLKSAAPHPGSMSVAAVGPNSRCDGNLSPRELAALVAGLTSENAAAVVASLARDCSDPSFAVAALTRWGEFAPRDALEWTRAADSPQMIRVAVETWLRTDPTGFATFLDLVPSGDWKARVGESAVRVSLQHGCAASAAAWLGMVPPALRTEEMTSAVVAAWGRSDIAAAASWIMSESDSTAQDRLLTAALGGYAREDPAGAARFALTVFANGDALRHALEVIVPAWSIRDAKDAGNWITQLPESGLRRQALDMLLPTWLARDEAGAREWVLGLPVSVDQSESVFRISQWAAQNDPALAVSLLQRGWAHEMPDSVRVGILRQWARWDFAKARAWADELPAGELHAEAQTALQAVANEPRGTPY